ncbi:MAG: hypothetical protein AB1746_13685 [Candidatus Zixiibacteriota bacterium]
MNRNIHIVTCYDGFFGQQPAAWESLDVGIMADTFHNAGFETRVITLQEIINNPININNSFIVYSGNPDREYFSYIEDALLMLLKHDNILIPSFDIHRCHENKGYQELYKRHVGINSLNSIYLGCVDELKNYDLTFPLVLKLPRGAAGRNIFLVHSKVELVKLINSFDTLWRNHLRFYFREKVKKYFFPYRFVKEYGDYFLKQDVRYILQPYIPNLVYDYKVIVFFNKFYSLKRLVRKNDFRASGSGKIFFESPPDDLLDYAAEIYKKLDTPIAGLDICFDGKQYHLMEFQGIHFGPVTMVRSEGYYKKEKNGWEFIEEKPNLENEYASAIIKYIREKYKLENPDR